MGAVEEAREVEVTDPQDLYLRELEKLNRAQVREEKREKRLGYAKLGVAFVAILAASVLLYYVKLIWLLLVPAAAFISLAVMHEHSLRQIRDRRRSINFYERGIARIQDRWSGTGATGERFLEPSHPYARDLDLFGPASLFELLC